MASQEEFNPTTDELKAIGEAMKNEEFRKLLAEYAEEISNPESKQRYEDEIRQMEAMQGNDVKFINPEPGWVVKTALASNGTKIFINICQSDTLDKPQSKRVTHDGKTGMNWSIPHSIASSREDVDKEGRTCVVYDAVFHPDALRLAGSNDGFKQLLTTSAMDSIERQFPEHALDRSTLKYPKMKFKGNPSRTIIRESNVGKPKPRDEVVKQFQATLAAATQGPKAPPQPAAASKASAAKPVDEWRSIEHSVVYQSAFDIANTLPQAASSKRPEGISLTFQLPDCASASGLDLDVTERSVRLQHSELKLHTEVKLSYPVLEDKGTAKFDKKKRQLKLTLPIAPPTEPLKHVQQEVSTELVQELPSEPVPHAEAVQTDKPRQDDTSVQAGDLVVAAPPSLSTLPSIEVACTQEPDRLIVRLDSLTTSTAPDVKLHTETFGPVEVHGVDVVCTLGVFRLRFDARLDPSTLKWDTSSDNTVVSFVKAPAVPWHRIRHGWQGQALTETTLLTAVTLETQLATVPDPYAKQELPGGEGQPIGPAKSVVAKSVDNQEPQPAAPTAPTPQPKASGDAKPTSDIEVKSPLPTADKPPSTEPTTQVKDAVSDVKSTVASASSVTQSLLFDLDD
eukprot:m.133801 g.133801  ORF g.133801 m.133801 type:complete len:624 (+) comp15957_c0_seq1:233-2104(+)